MRRYGTTYLLAVAAVGLATLMGGANQAQAGFTITLESITPSGSEFLWNYRAQITTGDDIRTGDFFRIYDFFGYVPNSISAPANWTATTQLLSATPPPDVLIPLGDDAAVQNLIFTYTGAATISGPTTLFNFTARSVFGLLGGEKNYVGRNTQASGPTAGQFVDVVGRVRVPAVPEPASVISTSLGVVALGIFYGIRRKKNAVKAAA